MLHVTFCNKSCNTTSDSEYRDHNMNTTISPELLAAALKLARAGSMADAWRTAQDVNRPRLIIRWVPPDLRARLSHRIHNDV